MKVSNSKLSRLEWGLALCDASDLCQTAHLSAVTEMHESCGWVTQPGTAGDPCVVACTARFGQPLANWERLLLLISVVCNNVVCQREGGLHLRGLASLESSSPREQAIELKCFFPSWFATYLNIRLWEENLLTHLSPTWVQKLPCYLSDSVKWRQPFFF